jgi:hypothetical protein
VSLLGAIAFLVATCLLLVQAVEVCIYRGTRYFDREGRAF